MNVFEDLIVELQEENLLELTVIEADDKKKAEPETRASEDPSEESKDAAENVAQIESDTPDQAEVSGETEFEVVEAGDESEMPAKLQTNKPTRKGKEFFKKRAIDEVSSHQMVEHILTGVEREYMKIVPKTFDDFNAKKSLHTFLNIAENSNSEEHKAAEFALMQETEAWGLALLERDRSVPVSHIRHYCENSRPALSSQAMLALARFYRNAPYSETIRAKFDFVITRLFSRPVEHDKRICLFGRDEILSHVSTLYSDWSSIPLYSAEIDESKVLLTGLSFDDMANEAERATHFDQLIESDFFGRLRLFKESINELFYEPSVTAAAIESNVRIGNAYVDLIVRERQKMDSTSIQLKYIEFNDQSVSDAAGRTLNLAEVLNGLTDEVMKAEEPAESDTASEVEGELENVAPLRSDKKADKVRPPIVDQLIGNLRNINRGVLALAVIGILLSGGLYIGSTFIVDEPVVSSANVIKVELDGPPLSDYVKTGRISRDTFYGMLLPTWDNLPKEKREEYLQKVYQLGATKGFKQVALISDNGKTAGFASASRMEVYMP